MNLKFSTLTHLLNGQHIFGGVNGMEIWQITITFVHEVFTQFTHYSQLYVQETVHFLTFLAIIPVITAHKLSRADL